MEELSSIIQSEGFIEKYSEKVKDSMFDSMLDSLRTKINRILQKENLYFDDEGYLILQSENNDNGTRICNFFVLPTHSLHFDDGEKIYEAGIAVELYSQLSDDKYKRILVNLSDEVIDKGNWLTSTFVDRDFLVYKTEFLHRYLRVAIKLSSRIIKDKARKVFYDGEWLEDDEAVEHISKYRRSRKMLSIMKFDNENESNPKKDIDRDAVQFLSAQNQYISEVKLFPFPDEPTDEANEWGWEDNENYYLIYTSTWRWIRAYLNRNGVELNTDEKELDNYLIKEGVFESNEKRAKSDLKRADRRTTPLEKRVFMINKARFAEFLSQRENGN